jgi:hypothetical protein
MFESQNQSGHPDKSIPIYLKIFGALFALALLYLGYVFWSRAQEKQVFRDQFTQRQAQQAAADKKTFEGMGGNRFQILRFYASPTAISRGDSAELCYSLSNAKTVTLQPQPEPVWPSFSKCVEVSPKKTTVYTLAATDAAGNTKQQKVTVEVR